MSRLVYYSLSVPVDDPRPDLLRQLVSSVHSLRAYNRSVPIVVFVHGAVPPELRPALEPFGVRVHRKEPYETRLARFIPRGAPFLTRYPLLHKFLNFAELAAMRPRQVLYLDCDTLLAGDVDRLFESYQGVHVCAREEPTCARSHHGYDPSYLDEDTLADISRALGVHGVPPFNLGVVLFNHDVWNMLARLEGTFVSYAWRLLVWLAASPSQYRSEAFGEIDAVRLLREQLASGNPLDTSEAVPFPSSNEWILDQVALWLTLGHVDGLTYADFSRHDVLQNGEFLTRHTHAPDWILCHYFTQNMQRMEQWLHGSACMACQ